ncbi:MAG: ABC transporter substrate-binding protein [Lentisphaeria bacterium]|nr:ABC transporter substrate-binding protein [Lentisphaeria bacterium]
MIKKLLFPVAAVLFFLCGCVPAEYVLRVDPGARTPVTVAALLPLTGSNRIYAAKMREGLLAAATDINANGGIQGRQLQLEFIDTCGTAMGTRTAVDRVQEVNAAAMIAGYSTEEVSNIIQYSAALRTPTVIPLATSNLHQDVSPFVYRNCYSNAQQMAVLAAYLYHWRTVRRGAVFIDRTGATEYSREVARDFAQSVQDLGGEIVDTVILPESGEIPEPVILNMLAHDPEFILVTSQGKRSADILKILRKKGFTGIICGADSWDDLRFMDALLDTEPGDCLYTAFFSPENRSPEFKRFRQSFRKRFYHNPGACETQSYDALKFLAIALQNAGNLFEFDKNWRTIRSYNGAAAVYTMLKKGDIDRTVYLNSIGVRRGKHLVPYGRLSHKLQYSKLEDYKITETPDKL